MSMTALELIKAALRVNGIIASGETPSADMTADGLEALQILLREWSGKGCAVYAVTIEDLALVAGTQSYTIGTGATFDTTRPVEIVSASVLTGGISYPLRIIGAKQYSAISLKGIGGVPAYLFYNPGYADGTVYIWPPGSGTLTLSSVKLLTVPTALTDSIAFPEPYDSAIKWNLAEQIGPEYGRDASGYIQRKALITFNSIVSRNAALAIEAVSSGITSLGRDEAAYDINVG